MYRTPGDETCGAGRGGGDANDWGNRGIEECRASIIAKKLVPNDPVGGKPKI